MIKNDPTDSFSGNRGAKYKVSQMNYDPVKTSFKRLYPYERGE